MPPTWILGRASVPNGRREKGDTVRWWPLLLPFAYALHVGEEWWGGEGVFVWTERVFGEQLSPLRFVVLNAVIWPLFAALTVLAIRHAAYEWFLVTFATLVVVNALLHVLGTVVFGSYSPGLVTGLLLYVPVGSLILVGGRRKLPQTRFVAAVAFGVVIHAVVAVVAFA